VKARSLVFDLFGDYLRYRGGEARLRDLIALMEPFGVPDTTVRVVAARLRKEEWLTSRREGRETVYALAPATWDLLDEGRARIFERSNDNWDGHWHMVLYSVSETERALRDRMRKKLSWLGFGPLSPAAWVSPHDRLGEVEEAFAHETTVQLDLFHSRSRGTDSDRDIARRSWDLPTIDHDYEQLLQVYRPRLQEYRAGLFTGASALVERMNLVHEYRHFPFRDPDLPRDLLPPDWHGHEAHAVFLEAHELLKAAAEAHVEELLEASGPLAATG